MPRGAKAVTAQLLAGAKHHARERIQVDAGRAHARRRAGRSEGLSHEIRHTRHDQSDRPAQGRRQARRPHRWPAQDHRHRALRLRAARVVPERRPMATSSARPSPRAASRSMDLARRRRPRRACSQSSRRRMPASSARASFNTAKLLGGPEIEHYHQAIALVVAETFEQARAAAQLVRVDYVARRRARSTSRRRRTRRQARRRIRRPGGHRRRRLRGAFAAAPVQLDATYTTPDQAHAMMEPHASIAAWDGDKLTLWTVEPDDRLGPRRHGQDARHSEGERPSHLAVHRRRLRRQAVPARGCVACRARCARGRASGQGGVAAATDVQQHRRIGPRPSSASASAPRRTARSPPSRHESWSGDLPGRAGPRPRWSRHARSMPARTA